MDFGGPSAYSCIQDSEEIMVNTPKYVNLFQILNSGTGTWSPKMSVHKEGEGCAAEVSHNMCVMMLLIKYHNLHTNSKCRGTNTEFAWWCYSEHFIILAVCCEWIWMLHLFVVCLFVCNISIIAHINQSDSSYRKFNKTYGKKILNHDTQTNKLIQWWSKQKWQYQPVKAPPYNDPQAWGNRQLSTIILKASRVGANCMSVVSYSRMDALCFFQVNWCASNCTPKCRSIMRCEQNVELD